MRRAPMLAALLLAGSFAAGGTAFAEQPLTPMQKAELDRLSPGLRQKVEARLTGGQTVHGVIETMLLNDISHDFAANRVVATDMERGDVVVEGAGGQLRSYPFAVETLAIRR